MGDDNYSLPFVESFQIIDNLSFVVCIERIGRFIEKDELRILIDGPGDQDTLSLPLT